MSYGELEIKYIIDKEAYLMLSAVVLIFYTWIIVLTFDIHVTFVMFTPHIVFMMGWIFINEYNNNHQRHNDMVLDTLANADNVYHNLLKEALKV
jgi:hypothetical protein